jgi:hypothetical protein
MGVKIDGKSAIAGAGIGLALGLGAGYLVGQLVSRRKAQELIDQETDAARDYYRAKLKTAGQSDHAAERPAAAVGTAGVENISLGISGDPRLVLPGTGILSVSGTGMRAGERDDSPDGAGEPSDPVLSDIRPRRSNSMIYVITLKEFADEQEDYEKVTLTWYKEDNALLDQRNIPIRDVDGTIGTEFHKWFGYESGSDFVVYVRNNGLEHDFEVVLNEGSYAGEVLNYGRPQ